LVFHEDEDLSGEAGEALSALQTNYPQVSVTHLSGTELLAVITSSSLLLDCIIASRKIEDSRIRSILSHAACPVVVVD
ncbi:MAG: hypothetical protein R3308_07930, partial [Thiohalobacterales bacterium]|nr:hypothetical protein [Thiohalobacterales bacterium]